MAIIYAVGLGVGETMMNWGNWQYAPLWIVDYMVVIWLYVGAFAKGRALSASILTGAWSFAVGVMYMAGAVSTDPAMNESAQTPAIILGLIGLLAGVSLVGIFLSYKTLLALTDR